MVFIERFAGFLLWLSERAFRPLAVAFFVTFLWFGPALYPLKVNNTLATLLEVGTPQEQTDLQIKSDFGDLDEIMILAYHDAEPFTLSNARLISGITEKIARISGVRDCFSLSSTPFFKTVTEGGEPVLRCDPLLKKIPATATECAAIKLDALKNKLFLNNIISRDGNTVAFNIIFQPNLPPYDKERIVREIRAVYQEQEKHSTGRFYFTGMHVFMETTGKIMQVDIGVFSILSLLVLFVSLLFIFRSLALAIIGLGSAIVSNALLFLTLHLLGREMSISTTPVPAITMGLALAYSLHILAAKHEGNLDRYDEAHEIFVGSIFSALTSIIGFSTTCFNTIPTLVDFGIYAVIGTFFAWLTALFFTYPLARMARHRPHPHFARRFKFLLRLATARYRRLIAGCALVAFFSGFLILRMEVQTDYYQYYRQSSPMTRSVDFVNRTIGGQYPIVIELDTKVRDGVFQTDVLHWLEKFKRHFESITGVDKVITYLDLLNEGYSAYAEDLPAGWYSDRQKVSQIAMIVHDANPDLNGYYVNARSDRTLIFVRTSHINSASFLNTISRIQAFLKNEPLENGASVNGKAVNGKAVNVRAADVRAVNVRAVDGKAVDGKAGNVRAVDGKAVNVRAVNVRTVDGKAVNAKAGNDDSENDTSSITVPGKVAFKVGGIYQRCVDSANSMAISQFHGTFLEILVLFTVAFFIIKSMRLTAIAFIANLLPIFAVYGLLSLLGESLNMGTTTIASISLSIGLDDTIHFVVRYISAYQKDPDALRSTQSVIRTLGTKMMLASLMISLAFFTLAFSNILPVFQLGIYTVVTMVLCFLCNMFLVPVLITHGASSQNEGARATSRHAK